MLDKILYDKILLDNNINNKLPFNGIFNYSLIRKILSIYHYIKNKNKLEKINIFNLDVVYSIYHILSLKEDKSIITKNDIYTSIEYTPSKFPYILYMEKKNDKKIQLIFFEDLIEIRYFDFSKMKKLNNNKTIYKECNFNIYYNNMNTTFEKELNIVEEYLKEVIMELVKFIYMDKKV